MSVKTEYFSSLLVCLIKHNKYSIKEHGKITFYNKRNVKMAFQNTKRFTKEFFFANLRSMKKKREVFHLFCNHFLFFFLLLSIFCSSFQFHLDQGTSFHLGNPFCSIPPFSFLLLPLTFFYSGLKIASSLSDCKRREVKAPRFFGRRRRRLIEFNFEGKKV